MCKLLTKQLFQRSLLLWRESLHLFARNNLKVGPVLAPGTSTGQHLSLKQSVDLLCWVQFSVLWTCQILTDHPPSTNRTATRSETNAAFGGSEKPFGRTTLRVCPCAPASRVFPELVSGKICLSQERLSDLIGPYWGTYGIAYRVLQPLLESLWGTKHLRFPVDENPVRTAVTGSWRPYGGLRPWRPYCRRSRGRWLGNRFESVPRSRPQQWARSTQMYDWV